MTHSTPHDSLFKWTFSTPARAAEQLRSVLPAEVSARIEWDGLRPEKGEYVDDELKGRLTDLLFSVPTTDGRKALLYLLFEHQSEPHRLMPLRLLSYTSRIWSEWLREHPNAHAVPPVLSVVLHHGSRGWTAPQELAELYDADPAFIAAAGPHLPALRLVLDDLSAIPDEVLRARAVSAMVRLALLLLKHGRDSVDIEERLYRWASLSAEVAGAASGLEALTVMMRYLLEVSEHATHEGVVGMLRSVLGTNAAEEVILTVGQQLIEQGRQKGLEQGLRQGLEKGLEQGLEQGERTILLRLLEKRFGDVPEATVARVHSATKGDLERWADQILQAKTLDDVFA